MCFSATASFIAGGSLSVLGVATLKMVRHPGERAFAAIPMLFGIQQLVEGMLWLAMQHHAEELKAISTYLFTIFSHVLWPVYVPYAIARMETVITEPIEAWRARIMIGFRITGMMVGLLLFKLVATQPLTAEAGAHIVYILPSLYDWPMMVFYVAATTLVAFFSRYMLVRYFGLAVLLALMLSWWFYAQALFSVWCFFAAILSMMVYLHFRREDRSGLVAASKVTG